MFKSKPLSLIFKIRTSWSYFESICNLFFFLSLRKLFRFILIIVSSMLIVLVPSSEASIIPGLDVVCLIYWFFLLIFILTNFSL